MADADPKIQKPRAEEVIIEPAPVDGPPEVEVVTDTAKPKRSMLRPLLMFGVPVLILAVVGFFWLTSGGTVSTDNAYVKQDKVSVSSDVAGRIVEVGVRENQVVKAGDILFRIDPDPYRIAVSQADATIANAQVQVQTLETTYQGTGSDIEAAQDRVTAAQQDFDRQNELMKRGFTTRARLEQAQHAVEQARTGLLRARSDAAEARAKLGTGAQVPGQNPAIASARVQRDKAVLDLSRTVVRAPVGGIVAQSDRLQVGQMMMTGLPAVTIVGGAPAYVEANFKETDLNHMRVGQPTTLTFDAYPGLKLRGHVQSIGALTGSAGSIMPAQNANGNWVKVTQRVPVRIAIDEQSPRPMIAGLSTKVTVDVR